MFLLILYDDKRKKYTNCLYSIKIFVYFDLPIAESGAKDDKYWQEKF
jgi:hypothetical protein